MLRRSPLLLLLAACTAPVQPVVWDQAPREATDHGYEVVIEGGTNVIERYGSLAEAVASAVAAGGERRIVLPAGDEPHLELPIVVDAPFISIVTQGEPAAVIQGAVPGQPVLTFTARAVGGELENVRVVDAAPSGGVAVRVEAGMVSLVDVELGGRADASVLLDVAPLGHVELDDSRLEGFDEAIRLSFQGTAEVRTSRFSGGDVGVVIEGGTNVVVQSSLFHDTRIALRNDGGAASVFGSTFADGECVLETADAGSFTGLINVAATGMEQVLRCGETSSLRVEQLFVDGGTLDCPAADGRVRFGDLGLDPELRPVPGSPLVDAGVVDGEAWPLDLLGTRRANDGDFDGVPLPDVGAFEATFETCQHWNVTAAEPALGEWTQTFLPRPAEECATAPQAAGATYRGRVVAVDTETATVQFFPIDTDLIPTRDLRFQILDARAGVSCETVRDFPMLHHGTWPAGQGTLEVTVPLWNKLPADDPHTTLLTRRLVLVTGTEDEPDGAERFAPHTLQVQRRCE